jgi:hypothetical protein
LQIAYWYQTPHPNTFLFHHQAKAEENGILLGGATDKASQGITNDLPHPVSRGADLFHPRSRDSIGFARWQCERRRNFGCPGIPLPFARDDEQILFHHTSVSHRVQLV